MNKFLFSIICMFGVLPMFGQDLIVTTSGDSIECHVIKEKSTKVKIEQQSDKEVIQYYISRQIIKEIFKGYYTRLSPQDFTLSSNSTNNNESNLVEDDCITYENEVDAPPRVPAVFFSVEYGANYLGLKDQNNGSTVSTGGGFWKVNFSPIDLNGGSIGFTFMQTGTYSPNGKIGTRSSFNAYMLSLRIGPFLRGTEGSPYVDFGLGAGSYNLTYIGEDKKSFDASRFATSLSAGYVVKIINGVNIVFSAGILVVYGSELEKHYDPDEPNGYKYSPEMLALQLNASIGIMFGH
ncbi:hypothetical protein OAT16_00920 [Prolixibacteraceae bacterium]|nr:hypothetical protein [Prolixibacteraceae bacterium]